MQYIQYIPFVLFHYHDLIVKKFLKKIISINIFKNQYCKFKCNIHNIEKNINFLLLTFFVILLLVIITTNNE